MASWLNFGYSTNSTFFSWPHVIKIKGLIFYYLPLYMIISERIRFLLIHLWTNPPKNTTPLFSNSSINQALAQSKDRDKYCQGVCTIKCHKCNQFLQRNFWLLHIRNSSLHLFRQTLKFFKKYTKYQRRWCPEIK